MEQMGPEENLLDLLAEKYIRLRQRCEQMWNERGSVKLTNAERFLLTQIYGRTPAVSDLAKRVDITRQAIHKCLKSLKAKGLLDMGTFANHRRGHYVYLTKLGEACYRENRAMKQELEKRIALELGAENVRQLKQLLAQAWPD